MSRLTWRRVLLAAIGAAAVAWIISEIVLRAGSTPVPVPWSVPPLLAVIGGLALRLGWRVRQYRAGKRPGLDPLQAARTAMFAQACAYSGAVLAGAYLGYALALLPDWSHEPRRQVIVAALVALAGAIALGASGWVAERWCAADDGDGDRKPPGASASAA